MSGTSVQSCYVSSLFSPGGCSRVIWQLGLLNLPFGSQLNLCGGSMFNHVRNHTVPAHVLDVKLVSPCGSNMFIPVEYWLSVCVVAV